MNATQAKHFLLSIDEDKFIDWHNGTIDPFSDYFYGFIRDNDSDDIFAFAKDYFNLEVFIDMCKKSEYSEEDKYAIITEEGIFSFNTIEEYLNIKNCGDGIISYFIENEEESIVELMDLDDEEN